MKHQLNVLTHVLRRSVETAAQWRHLIDFERSIANLWRASFLRPCLMRQPVSFEKIEDYFEQASPDAVAQRVRRLIAAIIPFLSLEDELRNSIGILTEWSQPNLKQLDGFTEKYSKREECVQSFWLATAILYTEGLSTPANENYDEEVFFILSCLEHLGCSEQLYYQTIFYDIPTHEILEMYSS